MSRLTNKQLYEFQKWFDANKDSFTAARSDRASVAAMAKAALGFDVVRGHVYRAAKLFGFSFEYGQPAAVTGGDALLAGQVATIQGTVQRLETEVTRLGSEVTRLAHKVRECDGLRTVVNGLIIDVKALQGVAEATQPLGASNPEPPSAP